MGLYFVTMTYVPILHAAVQYRRVCISCKCNDGDSLQCSYPTIERMQCHPEKIGGHVFCCPQFCYRLETICYRLETFCNRLGTPKNMAANTRSEYVISVYF